LSGIAVCELGHTYPAVTRVITEQSNILTHCSNFFTTPNQEILAERLCKISSMRKVFFGNSGAEANKAAIQIARLFGHQQGIASSTVLVMENAFYGRALATLSASSGRRVQAGFESLVRRFTRVPFDDIQALQKIADNNRNIYAIIVEPI
jgi:acetylornithine/N-succinyldiaminopimelate aminotransferase